MTRLAPHFTLAELTTTKTGIPNRPPPALEDNLRRLAVDVLEPLREQVGRIKVHSGYRSPAVNRAVGGSSTSDHLTGRAADIRPTQASLEEAWGVLLQLMAHGLPVDQAIRYPGHIHVSYRDAPRREVYTRQGSRLVRGQLPALHPHPDEDLLVELETIMAKLNLPTKDLVVFVGELLLGGLDPSEIGREVGKFLDGLLDFEEIVEGPVGDALEAIDGPVLVAAATLIARLFPGRARAAALSARGARRA